MALDVWFPDDVTRILTALSSAGCHYGPEYHAALRDVALAFGVDLPPFVEFGQVVDVLPENRGEGRL